MATNLLYQLGNWQTRNALLELTQRRVAIMRRFAELTAQRHRTRDIGQVDLDLARLSAIDAELLESQAAADAVDARQSLVSVVGACRAVWPALPVEFEVIHLDPDSVESILSSIPEIRAEQDRVAALRNTIELRTREQRPDPTIGLRGGQEDTDALVGVAVTLPLFVRNNFQAEVDAASADLLMAERELQDLYRRGRAELLSSVERYRLIHSTWRTWQRAGKPSLDRQFALLQRTWKAGELSTTDYLVQLTQALATRQSAIELRGRLWQARTDWLVATGSVLNWLNLSTTERDAQ